MTPKLQNAETYDFTLGSVVEISSDDGSFRGSWYLGTIIRRPTSKASNKYLVEYKEIFEDTVGTKRLRETFDAVLLRPPAPREKNRTFKVNEEVDAYHDDGWWEGTVTEDHGDGNFSVFCRHSKEQLVKSQTELRLHREWVNGVWSPPLEDGDEMDCEEQTYLSVKEDDANHQDIIEEKPNKSVKRQNSGFQEDDSTAEDGYIQVPKEVVFGEGMQVEVSSDDEGFEGAWFEATVLKALGNNKYLIEYQRLRTEDDSGFEKEEVDAVHIRPIPPTLAVDSFSLLDEVDAFYTETWWVGVVAKVLTDSKYLVFFKDTDEELVFKYSDLRPHQDWINGKWIFPSKVLK